MNTYLNRNFWAGTAERAIKTFAQAALALIGTSAVAINTIDWTMVLASAATAALLSVLTSIATPETATRTPTPPSDTTVNASDSTLGIGD
ncbi:holin [Mobiluncus mulieris]|uniref:Holin n=1 Tax=Mobiluncus mulieris TaxID=2052 RepID=A0A7Y0YHC4_9ACTO|nr:holin [Mobiluncus mulieris]NMX02803.1 hypothetical protein [Mobiluncus mulieris]